MKKFIAVIAAVAFAIGVEAQQYSTTTTSTNLGYAAVTTNTINGLAFTATKNGEVAVQVSAKLTAAGTSVSEFVFQKSVDGSTYDSQTVSVPLTQAGTVTATYSTNMLVGAYGYIRLKTLSNLDDDGVLTNVVVSYTVKPNRQDGK